MSCWNSWIRNLTGHLSLIVQVARIIGVTDEQKRLMGVGSGLELVTLPHGHQLRQDLLERYTQPAHYFKNQSNVTLCQSSLEVLVYLVAVHRNCKRISFYLFVSLFGVFCTSFFFLILWVPQNSFHLNCICFDSGWVKASVQKWKMSLTSYCIQSSVHSDASNPLNVNFLGII